MVLGGVWQNLPRQPPHTESRYRNWQPLPNIRERLPVSRAADVPGVWSKWGTASESRALRR